jgi:dTDP-4-amino-4,6-dideoxygalactose transaminase
MTLDRDDMDIARYWLAHREAWDDITVVRTYEREFAKWNGSCFAFAFQAGRKALSACIFALDLRPGDEVIVPAFTCVLVPNAFRFAKVTPIFCDIELDSYGPDVHSIERVITPRTKAILVQHLFGLVCRDYEAILYLSKRANLKIIEDAAQATGASFYGQKIGTRGHVGFYSSEHSKIFNTVVGGVAVTNEKMIAARLQRCAEHWDLPSLPMIERQLLNVELDYYRYHNRWSAAAHAMVKRRDADLYITNMSEEEIRGNLPRDYFTRMPSPIAALALNQLKKIDRYNSIRRSTAKRWDLWCRENSYSPPLVVPGSEPVYLRYPVNVDPKMKTDISWASDTLNVELGVWFQANIHPRLNLIGYPNAEFAVKHCVNFPTILYA